MVVTVAAVSQVLNLVLVCPDELQVSETGASIGYGLNFTLRRRHYFPLPNELISSLLKFKNLF